MSVKFHDLFMDDGDFRKAEQSRRLQQQIDYQEKERQLLEQMAISPELTFEEEDKLKYTYCPADLRFGTGRSIKQFTRRMGMKKK